VIGRSSVAPIRCRLRPSLLSLLTRAARRDILVSSLLCHVNLPSAAFPADFILQPSPEHRRSSHISGQTTLLACSRPRTRPTCDPVFSPAPFRIRSAGCSIEASMVQFVICHSHVGKHRPFSSQVSQNQGTAHIIVSTSKGSSPRSDPDT